MQQEGEFIASGQPTTTLAQPVAPVAEAPKKTKSGKAAKILCVVFALATVGLGGYIVYDKVSAQNNAVSGSAPEKEQGINGTLPVDQREIVELDAESEILAITRELYGKVREYMGDYEYDVVTGLGLYGNSVDVADGVSTSTEKEYAVKIGREYERNENQDYVHNRQQFLALRNNYSELKKIADEVYGAHGLKVVKEGIDGRDPGEGDNYAGYESDDGKICDLYFTPSNQAFMVAPVEYSCTHKAWLTDEKRELVKALAESYYKANGEKVGYISALPVNIVSSGIEGYQHVEANSEESILYFYRKSPDDEWIFFKDTQGVLLCSEFDTDDLKNAYAGERCYVEGQNEPKIVKGSK